MGFWVSAAVYLHFPSLGSQFLTNRDTVMVSKGQRPVTYCRCVLFRELSVIMPFEGTVFVDILGGLLDHKEACL
jgi:hypothetical protein